MVIERKDLWRCVGLRKRIQDEEKDDVKELLCKYEDVDTAAVVQFPERVCKHSDCRRFPEDEFVWKTLHAVADIGNSDADTLGLLY